MSVDAVKIERPDRWDHPLDAGMSTEAVSWLLKQPPFSSMDVERFARTAPLQDILRNDTRLVSFRAGDLVFQEGQYGGSAFLVLSGNVQVFLSRLFNKQRLGQQFGRRQRRWRRAIASWLRPLVNASDRRRFAREQTAETGVEGPDVQLGYRGRGADTQVFLQDIPGVLSARSTAVVGPGELFGELAAVTRTPREFTAAAESECVVLEIRWQGLKLLKQDPAFRRLLDTRYRQQVLGAHLRETPLFRFLPVEGLQAVVMATRLEQFGELEWYARYHRDVEKTPSQRIANEPMIAEEGSFATGLWIVRSGFARLSRRQGAGHRTLAYLGKGQMFGLEELVHNWRQPAGVPPLPYQQSLRAIGYVDVLWIPKQVIIDHVLPFARTGDLPASIREPHYQFGQPVLDAPLVDRPQHMDTGLLEFLVDQRLMNGRQAMVIDTERCTRCDDCVKACASTHSGTPVFERRGPQYGRWMFAHACMHCEDPVCMIGCPTGAIHRDHETGLVEINEATCIGCKTCAESCPYDNIRMVPTVDQAGRKRVDVVSGLPILKASKCDMCAGAGGRPSCQAACPHDALVRIDMADLKVLGRHVRRAG
jgi:Fe-S-cluster-containing dehydrogenase component/CRP-like cAMP-binding protein